MRGVKKAALRRTSSESSEDAPIETSFRVSKLDQI